MLARNIVKGLQQNFKYFSTKNIMDYPEVAVKEGKLKGSVRKLLDGSAYFSFKGVPYAAPPLGKLRFQAPQPPLKWQGVRDATKHGSICPQYDIYTAQALDGNEDCLFLNIYTKTLETTSKLPVMVFIHGGGFMSGSGDEMSYGPEFLLQHDVLLITLNYRLETLGFLCLDTPEVPGNAGVKDQVAALRWIKENVTKFGGDPDNVTLFGESAGAASVTYHMLSPMSKGLFHKAIAQSGTCLCDWAIGSDPKERAFRAGKTLGKETEDETELLKHLRSQNALSLAKVTVPTRSDDEKFRGLPMHFVPIIEKKFDHIEQFLTEDPMELLLKKQANTVPLIIGYNSAEGLVPLMDQIKKASILNDYPSFMLPKEIAHRLSKERLKEMGERVKKYYLDDKNISMENVQAVVDLQTDRQFSYCTVRFAHYYSKLAPTYMYRFDCITDLNITKSVARFADSVSGASHVDELFYMFSTEMTRDMYKEQEKLRDVVFKVTKLWTDFAKTGNPTPDGSIGVNWEQFTPAAQEYLHIGETFSSASHPDKERIAFWDKLYSDAGLPSINGIKSNL